MNTLTHCTLTGVDAWTDIDALIALAARNPFAEFGLLLSPSRAGNDNRYPEPSTIAAIVEHVRSERPETSLALHLCGAAVPAFVLGDEATVALANRFDRIQLNFRADAIAFGVKDLRKAIARFEKPVITQHNAANAAISPSIRLPNHYILFDSSGGRGIREDWPAPLPGMICGYAGGIGPDSIEKDSDRALEASGGEPFWIDMENRIRSEDRFDLDKCDTVLARVQEQIERQLNVSHAR